MEESFKSFLNNVVNLNQTRYDRAVSSVDTIIKILKNNPVFGSKFISIKPQGSFRQETIIKPVNPGDDFDVDLMFEMKIVEGWAAEDYLKNLANEFGKIDTYKDKVDTRGKTRCVTIDYDTEFHIDIVPAIVSNSVEMIMNKKTNQYEVTDGDGYARWFESQNAITGGNLKRVVRLMKYIRDSKKDFEIKSVLLTTLLGLQVSPVDSISLDYPDIHTSFYTLILKLDFFLQAHAVVPMVNNPVLSTENFNRHWNPVEYSKFRNAIHKYTGIAEQAILRNDANEWKKIFGDQFLVINPSTSIGKLRDPGEQFISDLGISEDIKYSLQLDAKVEQSGFRAFFLKGSAFPLKKKRKLTFSATGNFPSNCLIKWKVKNYDKEAKDADNLRGEIIDDHGFRTKIEHTKYTGAHYVEAYAIQGKICVAKDRLTVPIANAA